MSGNRLAEQRYPVKRQVYINTTGTLLQVILRRIFSELGFETKTNSVNANDVDIRVFKDGHFHIVGEILNWSQHSYMSNARKQAIVDNLIGYPCNRVLIYTCMQCEDLIDDLGDSNIESVKIGYQVLPRAYYDFYAMKNQIEHRRSDSKETRQIIKSKIVEYLKS